MTVAPADIAAPVRKTTQTVRHHVCTDSVDNFVIKRATNDLSHCFVINPDMLPNPRAVTGLMQEFPTVCVDKPLSNDITNPSSR
jgi:hypothetical protein